MVREFAKDSEGEKDITREIWRLTQSLVVGIVEGGAVLPVRWVERREQPGDITPLDLSRDDLRKIYLYALDSTHPADGVNASRLADFLNSNRVWWLVFAADRWHCRPSELARIHNPILAAEFDMACYHLLVKREIDESKRREKR